MVLGDEEGLPVVPGGAGGMWRVHTLGNARLKRHRPLRAAFVVLISRLKTLRHVVAEEFE